MHRTDMPGRQAMLDQLTALAGGNAMAVTSLGSLGFENAYVFAMRADRAQGAAHHEPGRPGRPSRAADRRRFRDFLPARMARGGCRLMASASCSGGNISPISSIAR